MSWSMGNRGSTGGLAVTLSPAELDVEVEAGGSCVPAQTGLHREFKTRLSYKVRICIIKQGLERPLSR